MQKKIKSNAIKCNQMEINGTDWTQPGNKNEAEHTTPKTTQWGGSHHPPFVLACKIVWQAGASPSPYIPSPNRRSDDHDCGDVIQAARKQASSRQTASKHTQAHGLKTLVMGCKQ